MRDLNQALIDISNIKGQMASGSVFQGFGPAVIAVTGVLAMLTSSLQLILPTLFWLSDINMLFVWVVIAFIAATLIGFEATMRSKRLHGGLADKMVMNAIEQFAPAGFAGAITGAVMLYFSPEELWLLPGLWQLFVALGLFTAVRSLPPLILFVAAWYFLTGVCVLIIGAKHHALHPLMMGVPFAVGQFVMAYFLHVAEEKQNELQ